VDEGKSSELGSWIYTSNTIVEYALFSKEQFKVLSTKSIDYMGITKDTKSKVQCSEAILLTCF